MGCFPSTQEHQPEQRVPIQILSNHASSTSESPPQYDEHRDFYQQCMDHIGGAMKLKPELRNVFEREYHIIVDLLHSTNEDVASCIKTYVWVIIAFFQAIGTRVTLAFSNYENPDMENLSKDEYQAMGRLQEMYAMKTVKSIYDNFDDEAMPGTLELLKKKIDELVKDPTVNRNRRLERILGMIKAEQIRLSEYWDASAFDQSSLFSLIGKAQEAQRDNRVQGNLGFAIIGALQELQRDMKDRLAANTGTMISKRNFIIFTATGLDEAARDHIKEELDSIEKGASDYGLQVIQVYDHAVELNKHQRQLDDYKKNEADIYDFFSIPARDFFKFGPASLMLVKTVLSHQKGVDSMKGKHLGVESLHQQAPIKLPSTEDVRKLVGRQSSAPTVAGSSRFSKG